MNTKLTSTLLVITLLTTMVPHYVFAEPEKPASDKTFDITGAGATFPFPLIDTWRVEYKKLYSNVNLNYQSIGSGGGVKQHTEKTVMFGASDAPLIHPEMELVPGTMHIPEAIGSVTISYNIPEYPKVGLKMTGEVISDIFLGKIKKWNDPKIAELNPDVKLPDRPITVVHRSDASGTTFVFTDYLSKVSQEWHDKVGAGKAVPWPTGVGSAGNEGVAFTVRNSPYAIGYVELAYAFQNKMTYAFVQNADKTKFVEPIFDSISAAAAGATPILPKAEGDWSEVSITNAPGANSYPLASFTYLLVYEDIDKVIKDKETAKALIHLIYWMVTDGQKFSPDLLYVPLPSDVQELDKQGLARVKFNGETLYKYEGSSTSSTTTQSSTKSSNEIPAWIKNNAGWWAQGQIDDTAFVQGIQFLITKGIMDIPKTDSTAQSTSNEIPQWVKNNAGWWAEGKIGDADFISGIQFLIKNGVMKV